MTKSEAGRLGGLAVVAKYGRGHMRAIGKQGFQKMVDRHFDGDRDKAIKWLTAKGLFEADKDMANSEYKRLYYLPKLYSKLEFCNQQYLRQNLIDNEEVDYDFKLLRDELEKELKIVGKEKFTRASELNAEKFNSEVHDATRDFLDALKNYYTSIYNKGADKRDEIVRRLNETKEKSEAFNKRRQDYQNEAIGALVKNVAEPQRIVERNGSLVRKINPIYMRPSDGKGFLDFRTQFYVSEKYFAGKYFPTMVFNMAIIWLMTVIMCIALYYDLLRKLVNRRR